MMARSPDWLVLAEDNLLMPGLALGWPAPKTVVTCVSSRDLARVAVDAGSATSL